MAKRETAPRLLEIEKLQKQESDTLGWVLYGMLKNIEAISVNKLYRNGDFTTEQLRNAIASVSTKSTIDTFLKAAQTVVSDDRMDEYARAYDNYQPPSKLMRFWQNVVWHPGMLQNLLAGLISSAIAIGFTIWIATIPSCRKKAAEQILGQPIPVSVDSLR